VADKHAPDKQVADKHAPDDDDARPSRSRLRFWQRDKDGELDDDGDGHDKPDR
jgi:hypothetical protein